MKFTFPIITIAICVGVYFLHIDSAIPEVRALSSKKSNYEEVLMKSKELKVLRDNLLIDYNNTSQGDLERLNKLIPEKFNSVLFANDINAMASRNKLVVKDFKIDPQRTEDREIIINDQEEKLYKTTVVTFRIVGQYDQFLNFLKEVETSLRLIDIVMLSIKTTGGARSTDDSLEYLLEMNTYSLR